MLKCHTTGTGHSSSALVCAGVFCIVVGVAIVAAIATANVISTEIEDKDCCLVHHLTNDLKIDQASKNYILVDFNESSNHNVNDEILTDFDNCPSDDLEFYLPEAEVVDSITESEDEYDYNTNQVEGLKKFSNDFDSNFSDLD